MKARARDTTSAQHSRQLVTHKRHRSIAISFLLLSWGVLSGPSLSTYLHPNLLSISWIIWTNVHFIAYLISHIQPFYVYLLCS